MTLVEGSGFKKLPIGAQEKGTGNLMNMNMFAVETFKIRFLKLPPSHILIYKGKGSSYRTLSSFISTSPCSR